MDTHLANPDLNELARELAALTGEPIDRAIHTALTERLAKERLRRGHPADWDAKIAEFQDRLAALPVLDARSPDELIGYDEQGVW